MIQTQRIVTFLWFDGNAEQAMNHYISIFRNSRVLNITRWGNTGPGPKGSVLTVSFELDGQKFMAVNGGPEFRFSEAISLLVNCQTQREVDYYWSELSAGGSEGPCGWLKDKFGLSWQVCPTVLGEMLQGQDAAKTDRAMAAMLKMGKLDIKALQDAYEGRSPVPARP